MPQNDNTKDATLKSAMFPQFGMVALDAFDSPEFRALKSASVRTYIALAMFAGQDQTAWPKQATLARMTGLTRTTVNRSVKELCAAGLMTRTADVRRGKEVLIYTIVLPPSKRTSKRAS